MSNKQTKVLGTGIITYRIKLNEDGVLRFLKYQRQLFHSIGKALLVGIPVFFISACGPNISAEEADLIAKGKGKLIIPIPGNSGSSPAFSTKTIPGGTKSINVQLSAAPTLLPEPLQQIKNTVDTTTVVFNDLAIGDYTLTGQAFNQEDGVGTVLAKKVLAVTVKPGNNTISLGLEVNLQGVVKLTMLP